MPLAQAQSGRLAVGQEGSYTLSHDFMVLEDMAGQWTMDDVLAPQLQAGSGTCFTVRLPRVD